MAFAVETRMPFLDYRLIELVFAADYSAVYHDGLTKRVLREAFSDVLPEAILRRRDKIGFYTPLAMWMRANVGWIRSTLQRDHVESLGVVNWPRLERRIAELVAGDNGAQFEVWRSFILHLWALRFGVDQVTRTDSGTSRLAA
jgi:asparagine synthase (glutamine-hydrolysing)